MQDYKIDKFQKNPPEKQKNIIEKLYLRKIIEIFY